MFSSSEVPSIFVPDLSQPSISRACSDAPSYLRPTTPSSVHSSSSEAGDNDIIPPYHPAAPRTLVLCFDGTGDQFDLDVRISLSAISRRHHLQSHSIAFWGSRCCAHAASLTRVCISRTLTLSSSSACSNAMIGENRWSTIRLVTSCSLMSIAIAIYGQHRMNILPDRRRDLHESTTLYGPWPSHIEDTR